MPHPEHAAVRNGDVFLAAGKRATLRLEPLVSEGIRIAADFEPLPGQDNQPKTSMFTVRLSAAIGLAKCRGPLLVGGREGARQSGPASVGQKWTFAVKDRELTLDWTTGKIE